MPFRDEVPPPAGSCLGEVVAVSADGRASVDFPGNPDEPRLAWCLAGVAAAMGDRVLLAFLDHDPARPVIVGRIQDRVCSPRAEARPEPLADSAAQEVLVDGRRLVFDAREEIVLRCGAASITLRKDGKLLIQGTELVSKASGVNKIKGAAVAIN